nr:unnamed protein product [Callosobruchus analis]
MSSTQTKNARLCCSLLQQFCKERIHNESFPRDPLRRKEWLIKMRRDKWIPTEYSCFYEVHSSSEMWENAREDGTRKLKANAVPTVFSFSTKKATKASSEKEVVKPEGS